MTESHPPKAKEIIHRPDDTLLVWKDMEVSPKAQQKLWQVGQTVSDWLDTVTAANPELFPDDPIHGIFPRLGQQHSGFHQHDVLTHIVATEEALRSGAVVANIDDSETLNLLKQTLRTRPGSASLGKYALTLIATRLHDAGKFFEPRRPYDPDRFWEKPGEKVEKRAIKESPFQSQTHDEISQEMVAKLEPEILSFAEAEYIAAVLKVHKAIQQRVKAILGGEELDESCACLVGEYKNNTDYLVSGALVAIADDIGRGEPPQKHQDFEAQRQVTQKLCKKVINQALKASVSN